MSASPEPQPTAALARAVVMRNPYGLLVVEDGVITAANPAAARILSVDELEGRRCCTLLGCGGPDAPIADACLTERALEEGRALPEVRFDVAAPDGPRGIWVTASPLDARSVVLHLRPARNGDRRRRTDTAWEAGPRLDIRVLGRTRVHAPEGPLDGPWLRQRPGRLLKLLVANRRRMTHTDELSTAFWPGDDRRALQNVRYSIHDLRGRLEPDRPPRQASSFVIGHEGGYGLDLDRVHVDADEFERHARTGLAAAADGDLAAAQEALVRAAAIYQGEFLADEPYADWALAERDRLHDLAGRVLETLADVALEQGDAETAIVHLQRLAELDPLDQGVQRRLIALLLEQGRPGDAMRRYRQVRAAWQAAFGEDLEFDLASLRPGAPRAAAA